MKVAAYISDTEKLSIFSDEFEKSKEDAYPFAIFDNDKNNALFGRNQFLINDLVRLAAKIVNQPITFDGDSLFLFKAALLNKQNIYQRGIVKSVSTLIPVVSALQHEKLNPRATGELDVLAQDIINDSFANPTSKLNSVSERNIAAALGFSLIALNCMSEFSSLRLNSRNYILKALRYIIFDTSSNDAVFPELNRLKKQYQLSFSTFKESIVNDLLDFFKVGTAGKNHQGLISAISSICKDNTNQYKLNISSMLNRIGKDESFFDKLNEVCEKNTTVGQILLYGSRKGSNKDCLAYLEKAFDLFQKGQDDYSFMSFILESERRNTSILSSPSDYKALKKNLPDYPEFVRKIYLEHLNKKSLPYPTLFRFMDKYLLSSYYKHSDKAYQVIKGIVVGEGFKQFSKKISGIENPMAKGDEELFSEKSFSLIGTLLLMAIHCNTNPIDSFFEIANHKQLSSKIPNKNITYEDEIFNHETLESYLKVFSEHDFIVAQVESLERMNPLQFKLKDLFDFNADLGFDFKEIGSINEFKEALNNHSFKVFCDEPTLKLIERSQLVVISFGDKHEHYAAINVTKLDYVSDSNIYGLMSVIGSDVSSNDLLNAFKITNHLNNKRKATS